jgi:hypothetical protein
VLLPVRLYQSDRLDLHTLTLGSLPSGRDARREVSCCNLLDKRRVLLILALILLCIRRKETPDLKCLAVIF